MRRVVVTGMGAVTPIGTNVASYWDSLLAGRSGAALIDRFDTSDHKCKIAAEVRDFDPLEHFDKKDARKTARFVQMTIVASREAFGQAGLSQGDIDPDRFGSVIGVGMGSLRDIEDQYDLLKEKGPRRISPLLIPKMIGNEAAGIVSIEFGLKGPNMCTTTACASATHAIGESAWIIARGDADAIVAGGAESAITPLSMAGFANMGALTSNNENPSGASCPFDKRRDGFVMGEGAGILVLEAEETALARGATILAEVPGYGLTGDAYHITAPSPGGEGGARAARMALRHAGLEPEAVDYINAHGTSTPLNDKLETDCIKVCFGDHAYKLAISSNKSMIGHLLGGAGGAEAVATVKTIMEGVIPPTINYEEPDPECDLDYVPNEARKAEVNCALSFSLGFGGHNAALLLKRYEPAS